MTDYLRTRLRLASADFITISEPMREVCAEADAALQAQAAEIARLTQSLDDREASLIRIRDMLNQSRAENARLQADPTFACQSWVESVEHPLRAEKDELTKLANALLHQIDINDFQDSHGHNAKSFKAVHDLMLALTPPPPTKEQA